MNNTISRPLGASEKLLVARRASYANTATATPIKDTLIEVVRGRDAMAVPGHWAAMVQAMTATSFAFDLLAFLFGVDALVAIGWWTLSAAVPVTVATIATGVKSRLRLPVEEGEVRSFLRVHMALGPIFFGLLVAGGHLAQQVTGTFDNSANIRRCNSSSHR
jgi:hypothetical protein